MPQKTLAAACLLLAACLAAGAAETGQLDASESVFTVMAAINAAGYDTGIDSPSNHPLRQVMRRELAARKVPCLEELKTFFADHRRKNPELEYGQYLSFALSTSGPPTFEFRTVMNEVAPDAAALEGLGPLLTRFYREADISTLWQKSQPAFDELIARYHLPVTAAVTEVNGYLRSTGSTLGRRFQIFVDPLGAPNQIHIRSYAKEYFVVVTASPEPQINDVRHAYLHYLIDPMSIKYADDINKKKSLVDFAAGAPALEDAYKEDFLLLVTECLIKAVESRLARTGESVAIVDQALKEGYILTPFFAEHLPVYEKQEIAMRLYLPDMVKLIDPRKETQRLDGVTFAATRAVRKAKHTAAPPKADPTPAEKTLEEAEQVYAKKEYDKAKTLFARILRETDDRPLQARGYFGLARIAVLQKDPELGDKLFRKTLDLTPDPFTKSWSLVYLGRLAELARETEEALGHYRAALEVKGGAPGALQAAGKALGDYRLKK